MIALFFTPSLPQRSSADLSARRLDASDQLVELRRGVADVPGEAADDVERLLGLPDLDQFADEILVGLQRLQQAGELPAGVLQFLAGIFGLRLQPLPLVEQI